MEDTPTLQSGEGRIGAKPEDALQQRQQLSHNLVNTAD
jgi:hypothetical protein